MTRKQRKNNKTEEIISQQPAVSQFPFPMQPMPTTDIPKTEYNFGTISGFFSYLNDNIMYLNSTKLFAGVVMIMLNIGSKFITIQFSKSTEEYLKYSVTKQLLVFAMAWMGTRDIYTAFILTAIFVILSDYLFNEESDVCIVPHKYRVLHKLIDTNVEGMTTSDTEIASALAVLDKANREKQMKMQKEAFTKFDLEYSNKY